MTRVRVTPRSAALPCAAARRPERYRYARGRAGLCRTADHARTASYREGAKLTNDHFDYDVEKVIDLDDPATVRALQAFIAANAPAGLSDTCAVCGQWLEHDDWLRWCTNPDCPEGYVAERDMADGN